MLNHGFAKPTKNKHKNNYQWWGYYKILQRQTFFFYFEWSVLTETNYTYNFVSLSIRNLFPSSIYGADSDLIVVMCVYVRFVVKFVHARV